MVSILYLAILVAYQVMQHYGWVHIEMLLATIIILPQAELSLFGSYQHENSFGLYVGFGA